MPSQQEVQRLFLMEVGMKFRSATHHIIVKK
nr:MAG TPA: hypothetical protein [Caudoviricetes sp.]